MAIEQSDTQTKKRIETKKPSMYTVIMLNDDYTAMEFVVDVLIKIFQKDPVDAQRIMMEIHEKGAGEAGAYTYDIAMSKIQLVHELAIDQEYPLRCRMEKV